MPQAYLIQTLRNTDLDHGWPRARKKRYEKTVRDMKIFNLKLLLLFLMTLTGCLNSRKEDRKSIADSGSLVINSSRLEYKIEGKGLPCLVIGSSVYYPRTFSDSLKKRLKMYFVDLPWFSVEPGDLYHGEFGIQIIAETIDRARQELQLEKPLIIGHSIHGTIAYEYARQYPGNIRGIVMIGSPNIYGNDDYNKATDEFWATASAERKEKQNRNWIKLAESDTSGKEGETVREYLAMAPVYWYNPDYDAAWLWSGMTVNEVIVDHLYGSVFNNYSMFQTMNNIPAPTLVVMGKYDYAVPYTLWLGYESVSGLTVKLMEKSGHTPQLEQSNDFDKALLEWIDENIVY